VRKPALTIDATTAHVTVDPRQSGALLAWFRGQGVGCELRRPGWPGGPDLIDFGDPSPAEEQRIRAAFVGRPKGGG
jgi:hypothetical protein